MVYNAPVSVVLRVENLSKNYRVGDHVVPALRGVSLEVGAGEFVALMGVSGSGKSTLLHLIGGLDLPTAGVVEIEGHVLTAISDKRRTLFRRRRIGIVFQGLNLLPTLTAVENVGLPLLIAGVPQREVAARAAELLETVDLAHRSEHRPEAMSGGEQQRVAIARSLINHPAIVLADEPTGNLDTRHGRDIWRLLKRLAVEEGRTILAVTHEAAGATFADRVVVLRDGRIVGEIEPPGEDHAAVVAARYQELAG